MATNLQFIKSATCTSATSSLEVTDCFSAEYDVYKVILELGSVTSEASIGTRLIDSGGADSSSNYDVAILQMKSTSSFSESRTTNNTRWDSVLYTEGTVGGFHIMYVFNPYDSSSYTFCEFQKNSHYLASSTSTMYGGKGIGVHKVAEQITGISVIQISTRLENASLLVYGVK
jgi:hypothetical protein